MVSYGCATPEKRVGKIIVYQESTLVGVQVPLGCRLRVRQSQGLSSTVLEGKTVAKQFKKNYSEGDPCLQETFRVVPKWENTTPTKIRLGETHDTYQVLAWKETCCLPSFILEGDTHDTHQMSTSEGNMLREMYRRPIEEARQHTKNWVSLFTGQGDPSFVLPFESLSKQDKVVLLCRISSTGQSNSIQSQEKVLKDAVRKVGATVVDMVTAEHSAKGIAWLYSRAFLRALSLADKNRAVLLAVSLDRFIRAENYNPTSVNRKDRDAKPSAYELEQLQDLSRLYGVSLMTLLPVDVGMDQSRQELATSSRRNRKSRSRIKAEHQSVVVELHQQGMSLRRIARRLKDSYGVTLSHTTMANWLRDYRFVEQNK